MSSEIELGLEDAREQYFWAMLLRVLAASAIVLIVLAPLVVVTLQLGWQRHMLFCVLGLFAGGTVATTMQSATARAMAGLVVGAVALPLLASSLAATAAAGEAPLRAHTAMLVPFVVHAGGAFLAAAGALAVWHRRPGRPTTSESRGEEPLHGARGES